MAGRAPGEMAVETERERDVQMNVHRQIVKREEADRRTDKQTYRQCRGQQTETDSTLDRQMDKHSKVIDA